MNIPQPSHRSDGATRLSGIARLVRRICMLREQGEAAAAARLAENEFATAVRDLRLAEGLEAVSEGELQAMFVNEERRVADAVVLAELLIPQLVASMQVGGGAAGPRPSPSGGREAPVAFSAPVDHAAGTPAIPDLLDAMLAADAVARRQSVGRRAN